MRIPPELMFIEDLYKSQTLSSKKLEDSSYKDPDPGATVFTELPSMIEYYLTRWKDLNLLSIPGEKLKSRQKEALEFECSPATLLEYYHGQTLAVSMNDNNPP